jgi:sulfotransferase
MKKIHFIAGLPRSGSTLLSSILNQNPKFQASISGPLYGLVKHIIGHSSAASVRTQCPIETRKDLILNLVDTYYKNSNEIVFDTNRSWGLDTPLLADLYPDAKIIMCLRSVPWIIDSFETLVTNNIYDVTRMFSKEKAVDVYSRTAELMASNGIVGGPFNAVKQALAGPNRENILIVEYDHLAIDPKETIERIYKFINEPLFDHNFDDVEASYDEYDNDLNVIGLHHVRKKVEFIKRRPIIPFDLYTTYEKWDHAIAAILKS